MILLRFLYLPQITTLIAVLHSSLYHGLRLFDLVEDFGIHFSEMSCNAEVKADISSAVLNFSGVSCS